MESSAQPELDGAWFRALDFGKWDYWGSNADAGRGVWSMESGGTQGWITAVRGLRQMHRSPREPAAGQDLRDGVQRFKPLSLPDGDQITNAGMVRHLAVGKDAMLAAQTGPN